jgi:hypothetical protein
MDQSEHLLEQFTRERKREGLLAVAVTVVLLLSWGVIIAVGWRAYGRSIEAKRVAETEATRATVRRDAMLAEVARLERQSKGLQLEIASRTTLISKCIQASAVGETPSVAKSKTNALIAASTGDPKHPVPPRVYILIPEESLRAKAKSVAAGLQDAGYIVPSIERVTDNPRMTTLKYFESDEVAAKESPDLVTLLDRLGLKVRTASMGPEPTTIDFRPRHFELWFSNTPTTH